MKKIRLLDYLCRMYPHISRDTHFSRILCGEVKINNSVYKDPKYQLRGDERVSFIQKEFVSRGAQKLLTALDEWSINVDGHVMLDAGASTGGFTEVLLHYGAARVYAVDVGYNQLDFSLRKNPRVVEMERTNIMDLTALDPQPWGAVADLSFRSLLGAVEKIISLTAGKWCIALIKPQFELKEQLESFDGVIRDPEQLRSVLNRVVGALEDRGLRPVRLIPSKIKGTRGNQEFLVCIDQNALFFDSPEAGMADTAVDRAFS